MRTICKMNRKPLVPKLRYAISVVDENNVAIAYDNGVVQVIETNWVAAQKVVDEYMLNLEHGQRVVLINFFTGRVIEYC